MNSTLFIYEKDGTYKVLDMDQGAVNQAEILIADGWKLTASIISRIWLEHFLNISAAAKAKRIKALRKK